MYSVLYNKYKRNETIKIYYSLDLWIFHLKPCCFHSNNLLLWLELFIVPKKTTGRRGNLISRGIKDPRQRRQLISLEEGLLLRVLESSHRGGGYKRFGVDRVEEVSNRMFRDGGTPCRTFRLYLQTVVLNDKEQKRGSDSHGWKELPYERRTREVWYIGSLEEIFPTSLVRGKKEPGSDF